MYCTRSRLLEGLTYSSICEDAGQGTRAAAVRTNTLRDFVPSIKDAGSGRFVDTQKRRSSSSASADETSCSSQAASASGFG